MAAAMGIELLTEEQYRGLQQLGSFDTKTSSWLKTAAAIRKLGGAIFADCRYGHVFVYHNGAQSYYAARAFRGSQRFNYYTDRYEGREWRLCGYVSASLKVANLWACYTNCYFFKDSCFFSGGPTKVESGALSAYVSTSLKVANLPKVGSLWAC